MTVIFGILGFLLVIAILLDILYHYNQKQKAQIKKLIKEKAQTSYNGKPVLLLVIDSLMPISLQDAITSGKAPALKFLMENGKYLPNVVSAFPTMSVSIDSTLLTGKLPREHHIYGLMYYDPKEERIVNFGTGAKESLSIGPKNVLQDSLLQLNQHYLNPAIPTIHDELGDTASINALLFRGPHEHTITPPWLASWIGWLPSKISVKATRIFSFGSMHRISPHSEKGRAWSRFGMNDRFTRMELVSLIQHQLLPPFTIAYFPQNDEHVHRKGTEELKGIEKADQEIQAVLNAFPSWEEALSSCVWIVMGDSGQTNMIKDHTQAYVELEPLFQPYTVASPKQIKVDPNDQLVICVNERMAYIYLHDPQVSFKEIIQHCKQEARIDLIVWQEDGWIHIESGKQEGHMQFRPEGPFRDEYDQSWELLGDLFIADITINENQTISYRQYPDILMRLYGVIDTAERVVIITVSPGYEMVYQSSPRHRGGAHGSIHQLDSIIPLIICGTDKEPKYPRILDLKEWICQLVRESNETRATK